LLKSTNVSRPDFESSKGVSSLGVRDPIIVVARLPKKLNKILEEANTLFCACSDWRHGPQGAATWLEQAQSFYHNEPRIQEWERTGEVQLQVRLAMLASAASLSKNLRPHVGAAEDSTSSERLFSFIASCHQESCP
jgi:hypothetical protein